MSQILISVEASNIICAVETSMCDLMGYSPCYLIGQSFRQLFGPLTDKDAIGRAIIDAALRNTFTERIETLYELGGRARFIKVSFSPSSQLEGVPICCIVTLNEEGAEQLPAVLLST